MRIAKIEITVLGNAVNTAVEGMATDIASGLLTALVGTLDECRKPGVTNEQLASEIRDEILSRLNGMSESNAN